MLSKGLLSAVAGLAFFAVALPSKAATVTIDHNDFTVGASTAASSLVGGAQINWSITPAGRTFEKRTSGGLTGVGISGGTPGEINIGETLVGTGTVGFVVRSFTVGLLYDGPEFNDVQERAKVTVTLLDDTTISYLLINTYDGPAGTAPALWTLLDGTTPAPTGTVTMISPSGSNNTATDGGVFRVDNPFGDVFVKAISFTAVAGVPANVCGPDGDAPCTNQSDYTLVGLVVQVPEPTALALLGAGLLGLGVAARRRAGG